MSADFLVTWVVLPQQAIDQDKMHAVIDRAKEEDLSEAMLHAEGDPAETLRELRIWAHKLLDRFVEVVTEWPQDTALVHIMGRDVLITGGMSWGDAPTESYEAISDMGWLPEVLEAGGFSQ